jgi:hypothetical protein
VSAATLLIMVAAGVVAAASVWLLTAMVFPQSSVGRGAPLLAATETRALAALDAGDLEQSRMETWASLALTPYNAWAWCRLAYIEAQRTGGVNPKVVRALRMSYRSAPLGPEVTRWRLTFIFDHWDQVTPDIRRNAVDEIMARGDLGRPLAEYVTRRTGNPAGILALELVSKRLPIKKIGKSPRK